MSRKVKIHIKVWLAKSGNLRARITTIKPDQPSQAEEVTVGGKKWTENLDKYRQYAPAIHKKALGLTAHFNSEILTHLLPLIKTLGTQVTPGIQVTSEKGDTTELKAYENVLVSQLIGVEEIPAENGMVERKPNGNRATVIITSNNPISVDPDSFRHLVE